MASNATNRREQLRRQQEAQARQKRTTRIIGVSAGLLALVLIGVFAYVLISSNSGGGTRTAATTPPNANAQADALVVGPANEGKPTVTLYLDYQCPNCKNFEAAYGAMLELGAANGDWTLQNKTMTFMDQNLRNTSSTRAAIAASCSAVADAYPEYNKQVYEHQGAEAPGSEGFTDELLRDTIPAQVGITGEALTQFQACYDGEATAGFVESVNKSAYADGVSGTPSLAVNGRVLKLNEMTDPSPEGLKRFILDNA